MFSDLEYETTVINGWTYERFHNPTTGYESLWNVHTATDPDGLEGHTGVIVTAGDPTHEVVNQAALDQFKKFIPAETVKWRALNNDELDDLYPSTHTTGPGNRRYIAPALRYALSTTQGKRDTGVTALRTFCRSQHKRPLGHGPTFNCKEDLSINKGTPDAWDCDKKTTAGYNAFDPAHACMAIEFAAAMLGMDEGLEAYFMKYRILANGYPGTTTAFWYNQPRAAGWSFVADWQASWLGFTNEVVSDFFKGKTPKSQLKDRIDKYCGGSVAYDPVVSGPADPRTMTVASKHFTFNGVDYFTQCHGEYFWQKAVRTTCLALVCSDTMLSSSSPQRNLAMDYASRSMADALYLFDPSKGMAWAGNRNHLPKDVCDALKIACDDVDTKGGTIPLKRRNYMTWLAGPGTNDYIVAEVPITQDCALHLLGWILIKGKTDPQVLQLAALCPPAGSKNYQPQVQDPSIALLA